jgi:putative endonuclease
MSKGGYIYILSNRPNGTLFVKGFSKAYNLKRLVYYEQYDDIRIAIQRERTMKHWPRAWKVRLVNGFNRQWDDLYPSLIS